MKYFVISFYSLAIIHVYLSHYNKYFDFFFKFGFGDYFQKLKKNVELDNL